MKPILIKFLLEGGHWFAITLPENEAHGLVEAWIQKQGTDCRTGDPKGAFPWAVDLTRVLAMHAENPVQQRSNTPGMQLQPQGQVAGGAYSGMGR